VEAAASGAVTGAFDIGWQAAVNARLQRAKVKQDFMIEHLS
jgi:hypothetical protein